MRCVMTALFAGLGFCIFAAFPASATTLYEKQRVCPVGDETYKSFGIGSTSSFGVRLDLQRMGPAAHLPHIECPNGFMVTKDESEYTAEEIAKLTPLVASAEFQAARTAEVPIVRVIMQERALGKSDADLRHWYFAAASEAEYFEAAQLRPGYLAKAVNAFDAWLALHSGHDEEWWVSSVRRADILRQSGRFDEAIAAAGALEAAHAAEDEFFLKVAAQIRRRAQAHDSEPARYEDGTPP